MAAIIGRRLGYLFAIVAALVLLAGAAVLVLTRSDWGREQVRARLVSALDDAVNGTVSIGRIRGNLLTGATMEDLVIADSSGVEFLRVPELSARYSLRTLLDKRLYFEDVVLEQPVMILNQPPGGEWNVSRLFAGDTTTPDTAGPGWGSWLAFRRARVNGGHVIVRSAWSPDDTLSARARDSVIADVLARDGESRLHVVRVRGGYQQVSEFRDITGFFPLIRIADPDRDWMRVETDKVRMVAIPFDPPRGDVRALTGTFQFTGDSAWFTVPRLALPASRASLAGRYYSEAGRLQLDAEMPQGALADLQWLYPDLPDIGRASMHFAMRWEEEADSYAFRDLDVRLGDATLRGAVRIALSDTIALDVVGLRFRRFPTRVVTEIIPALEFPRPGRLSGVLEARGGLGDLFLDGDIAYTEPRSGTSRVIARGRIGVAESFRASGLELRLLPAQVALARIAAPSLPVGGTVTGRALVNGRLDGTMRAAVDLVHRDRGARSQVVGTVAVADAGRRMIDADVRLAPLALATVGRFAPDAGLRGAVAGPVRATGRLGDLHVVSDLAVTGGGRIATDLRLDLASPTIAWAGTGSLTVFNASAVTATAPATAVSGTFRTQGRGTDPRTMTGALVARLETSAYDSVAVDSAQIRVAVNDGLLRVDSTGLWGPHAFVLANGTLGLVAEREGSLDFTVAVDSVQAFRRYLPPADTSVVPPRPRRSAEALAAARRDSARIAEETEVERIVTGRPPPTLAEVDTAVAIRADSLAGSVRVTGRAVGSIARLGGTAHVEAQGVVARGNAVDSLIADVVARDLFTPAPRIETKARADSLSVAGFLLDSAAVTLAFQEDSGNVVAEVFQSAEARYAIGADYVIRPEENELRLSRTALQFDTTTWVSRAPAAIRWGSAGVVVDSLDLTDGRGGRLFADGRIAPADAPPAELDVEVRNFELAHLATLLQTDLFFGGLFSLQASVAGTLSQPVFEGTTSLSRATYGATGLPPVGGRFDYDGDELDAVLVARSGDRPDVGTPIAVITGQVPLALGGGGGPILPPDEPWQVDVDADSLPLDLIGQLSDAIDDVRGHAEGEILVRGTLDRPRLSGDLNLYDGAATLTPNGMRLRQLTGNVRLRNDTVRIDSIAARSNGRPVRLHGLVEIADIERPSFDLALESDGARVLDNELGVLDADARVTLKGPFTAPRVAGTIRLHDGVLYVPDSDDRQVVSADDPTLLAIVDTTNAAVRELVGGSPFVQNLRMDVGVAVNRDVWVRTSDANVEVYGDLDLRLDRASNTLVLVGTLNTDRGEYGILGRRFQLRQGSVTFIGDPELNPLLQLTGEVNVRQAGGEALAIRVIIGGSLNEPRITLESDAQPPIEQRELLGYLAFGQSTTSVLQSGGTSVGGGSGSTTRAIGNFVGQRLTSLALGELVNEAEGDLARQLGLDVVNIQPADVYSEVFTGNVSGILTNLAGVVQATELEAGKYVTPRTFVSLRARPTIRTAPGIRFEQRAGAGWRYEASYEPRFLLRQPTLEAQEARGTNALGVFIVREWKF